MNFLDIVILIPLGYAAWQGFKRGFIIEVFTLLALFVGLYAGIHFSEFVSNGISKMTDSQSKYLSTISFTLTFLAVGAMVYFAGKAIEKIVKVTMLTPLNKIGGVIFAILKGSYIVSVILMLLNGYDQNDKFIPKESKDGSLLYRPMVKFSSSTIPGLKNSNFFTNQEERPPLTVEQVIRAKELADSLGINATDVVKLSEIYYEYEK